MSTTLTNPSFPHIATISRSTLSVSPPYTSTVTEIWSGECDCQSSVGGSTVLRQDVFVSDYTIFCETLTVPIEIGDIVTVTFIEDGTPIEMTIEQHTSDNIYEEDGKTYGTTLWANKSHA